MSYSFIYTLLEGAQTDDFTPKENLIKPTARAIFIVKKCEINRKKVKCLLYRLKMKSINDNMISNINKPEKIL